jgi:hypothetical protein
MFSNTGCAWPSAVQVLSVEILLVAEIAAGILSAHKDWVFTRNYERV